MSELIRVHIPYAVNVSEGHAAAVSAVALDKLQNAFPQGGVPLLHLEVQIDGIGVVIHRKDFLVDPAGLEIQGTFDNQVHGATAFFVVQVSLHHSRATTAVDQVVEADPVDVFPFQQVEDGI